MNRHTRYPRIFFSTDSPAPGGGGSPAVLDGPISPAPESFDPTSYVPPDGFDVAKFIEGDGKDVVEPEPKPPAPKKDEQRQKPPEQKEPAPKQPEAKPEESKKEAPAAQLRTRLKELETREADLLKQLDAAKTDGRVKELSDKLEQNAQLIKAKEAALEESERKLVVHNPMVAKELVALRDKFNDDFKATLEVVPRLGANYNELVNEFANLPRGTAEYGDRLEEFQQKLEDQFGTRNAGTAFDAVRKGLAFRNEHSELAQRVQTDAQKILFEQHKKQWEQDNSRVDNEFDTWLKPPADAESADPFNLRLFLQKFEGTMEKAEVERVNGAVKAYIRNVTAGVQPRTKDDFPGLPEENIQREMREIEQRVGADKGRIGEVLAVTMKAAAYHRPLIARLAQLEERLAKYEGSRPPDPTLGDGQTTRGNNTGTLDDLDLPSPDSIAAGIR